jgi:hypothetical protein
VVVVRPGCGEVVTVVTRVEPRLLRDLDEAAPPVVTEEDARRTITRVVIGRGCPRFLFAGAEKVRVDAEIEIEKSVAVVIGHRDGGQDALQRLTEAKRVRDVREAAFAIIDEEQRLRSGGEHEVLVAVVLDVDEQRLRRVVEHADSRTLRHILESRITPGPEETIGEAGRLSDVEIFQPVAIGIANRYAMVAIGIARQHRVERGHPRVEIGTELPAERIVPAEDRGGHFREDRAAGAAGEMRSCRPLSHLPPRGLLPPAHFPDADMLDTPRLQSDPDNVVANLGPKQWRWAFRGSVDGCDQELGDRDRAQILDQPAQLRGERA